MYERPRADCPDLYARGAGESGCVFAFVTCLWLRIAILKTMQETSEQQWFRGSFILCSVAVLWTITVFLALNSLIPAYGKIYSDLGSKTSWFVSAVTGTQPIFLPVATLLTIIYLIYKEFMYKSKTRTFTANIVTIFAVFTIGIAIYAIILSPILQILTAQIQQL